MGLSDPSTEIEFRDLLDKIRPSRTNTWMN